MSVGSPVWRVECIGEMFRLVLSFRGRNYPQKRGWIGGLTCCEGWWADLVFELVEVLSEEVGQAGGTAHERLDHLEHTSTHRGEVRGEVYDSAIEVVRTVCGCRRPVCVCKVFRWLSRYSIYMSYIYIYICQVIIGCTL